MIIAVVTTAMFLLAGMLSLLSFRRCGKRFYLYFGVWYLLMAPYYVSASMGRYNERVLACRQLEDRLVKIKAQLHDLLQTVKIRKLPPAEAENVETQLADLEIQLSNHENELNTLQESLGIRHASIFWPQIPWSTVAIGLAIFSFVAPAGLYLLDKKRSSLHTDPTPLT